MNLARYHAKVCRTSDYRVVHVSRPLASLTPERARAHADEARGGVIGPPYQPGKRTVMLAQELH
jgi:hypothetical protein